MRSWAAASAPLGRPSETSELFSPLRVPSSRRVFSPLNNQAEAREAATRAAATAQAPTAAAGATTASNITTVAIGLTSALATP